MKKVKKALNKSAFLSTKKRKAEKMKVTYSFDRRRLIDEQDNILAMITQEGLIYLSPIDVSIDNFNHVKQFIEDYKPLGFYDKESEKIYYKKRNEEESTK